MDIQITLVNSEQKTQFNRYHFGHLFPNLGGASDIQKSQLSSKTTPMPHGKEASTQNSTGEGVGGLERCEPQKDVDNRVRHQLMSESTLALGSLWA